MGDHRLPPHARLRPATHPRPNTFQPRFMEMPGDRWNAWEGLRLPITAWTRGVDLLHCPANTCPRWAMLPTIVTVHDIIPLDESQYYPPEEVQRFEKGVRTACQNAWIMCPSQYTKDRLVDRFKTDPRRIVVNPWASGTGVKLVEPMRAQKVMNRYGIAPPFVLHLGASDPRKNTRSVIDAWAMIDKAVRGSWELVVVGLNDETRSQLMSAVERLGLEAHVHLLGYREGR
ncbi:MAG: glycosyltransferase family 4 protein [Phycisphaerales bacterium]|nr:glycosyltransferase family 4 protein [Phycisphaerales bacterium]